MSARQLAYKMKKAQGLPLNMIVLAIIVIVVLVLVILFFTGGVSKISTSIKGIEPATETDVTAVQTKCSQMCLQAQSLTDATKWKSTGYCTYTSKKDWDSTKTGLETISCWDYPITSFCSATIAGESLSDSNCKTA